MLTRADISFSSHGKAKSCVAPWAQAALHASPRAKQLQRLAKWFTTLAPKDKAKIVKDVSQLVLARRTRMCNFLEYKGR